MSEKVELVICLGSSCFARGNKGLVKKIDEFLRINHLKDKVYYHGGHCFGSCENGPSLMINGKRFPHVSEDNIYQILTDFFEVD